MWEQICLANKDNVLKLLDSYTKELEIIRKALEDNDGETLNKSFCEAKSFRDTL
jgi:prephenate dehydrogenase